MVGIPRTSIFFYSIWAEALTEENLNQWLSAYDLKQNKTKMSL
jgi:hypothetical protein